MEYAIIFIQGLISFFSPCVFPLIPVYMSYLSGQKQASQKQILINTFFFVLGISTTFFLLGLGFTALGQFFSKYQTLIARLSGMIMILFGLYQLGFFGKSNVFEKEHRLPFRQETMNPLSAFILGFTFSFAWTPCVGPALTSVLLMTGTAKTFVSGMILIAIYVAGFIIPFMILGFFTSKALQWMKNHNNIIQYTVKIGAILLILLGTITLTGWNNATTNYVSSSANSSSESEELIEFTLKDQNGIEHTLSDYKGKVVFLNFWATWCGPCKMELPHIQKVYEEMGMNKEDVVILGIVNPNGADDSPEQIRQFIESRKLTYPTLFDENQEVFGKYGIRSFPTTFMIDKEGKIYGYVQGALTEDMIRDIIAQTLESA